jgi:hypothetical protein
LSPALFSLFQSPDHQLDAEPRLQGIQPATDDGGGDVLHLGGGGKAAPGGDVDEGADLLKVVRGQKFAGYGRRTSVK